ncbi:MAG: L,D-transpeptidase family protein [Thermomicrobiales bacterium]
MTGALGALLLPLSPLCSEAFAQDQVIEPANPNGTEPPATTETPTPSSSQGITLTSDQLANQTDAQYFAATGHNLTTPFLQPWLDAGGENVLGNPLSEGRFVDTNGTIQQAFETLTIDYNPALDPSLQIQGVPLAASVVNGIASAGARAASAACSGADASCQFFPDTAHTMSGEIAAFWSQHGGQLLFGSPVSEPFKKNNILTQVFQRAVIDQDAKGKISLRKVMIDIVATSSQANDPAFVPAPPTLGKTSLVKSSDGLRLRAAPGADGEVRVVLPDNAEFIAADAGTSEWVPGYVDGYSGWVSATFLSAPQPVPPVDMKDWDLSVWQGAALGETNLRATATTHAKTVKTLKFGDQVVVTDWVKGEEVFQGADIWATLKDGSFVYSRNIGRSAPVAPTPIPSDAPTDGKWIDVNLTQQLMIAYDGRSAVRTCETTTGMPGWETPEGYFAINNRVANETMASGTIGAENFFNLKNVLFTQYFTDVGHAIHFAWWRTQETIGRPGSHGCLNLLLDDSQFYWDWAEIGTPVLVHK